MQDTVDERNQEAAPESGQESQEGQPELTVEQALQEWRDKAEDYLDKYRRSMAEFANYRKRVERDREAERLRIKRELFMQILPVTDDFERALGALDEEKAETRWAEGVALIARKMHKVLTDAGVKPIEALGQPFDPNYHAAVMREPSDAYPEGMVSEELQKGYMLEDAVLRPTMVKVSSGPGPA